MILLSQRDPQYAQQKIGKSFLSIGRYGCTLTCISMLSDYFGCFTSPAKIAGMKEWFTNEGLVIWTKLAFTKFKFQKRLYGQDDVAIMDAIKDPKKAVILEVDKSHWVVATGKSLFGGYKIADPWFGDRSTTRRYGKITGSALFIS
jgi:ABC-type bacteriocin/lantibiotic exporter with double-glycine peptidase domain